MTFKPDPKNPLNILYGNIVIEVTCFQEDEKEALKLVKKIISKMNTGKQIKLFK